MKIKLKENQKRENLIFTVKALTDAYDNMIDDIIDDTIDYYVYDIIDGTAQNNHNKLVEGLNGLKGAIDTQKNIKLIYLINKLNDMLE